MHNPNNETSRGHPDDLPSLNPAAGSAFQSTGAPLRHGLGDEPARRMNRQTEPLPPPPPERNGAATDVRRFDATDMPTDEDLDDDFIRFNADIFRLRKVEMGLLPTYHITADDEQDCCHVQRESHLGQRVAAIVAAVLVFVGSILPVVALAAGASSLPVRITTIGGGGMLAAMLATIAAGVLWPKRHFLFVDSLDRPRELMVLLQDQRVSILNTTYTVADGDLNLLGWFSRSTRGDGLLRQKWHCYDAEGELRCVVTEDAMWKTLLRHIFRAGGANFLPTCYVFKEPMTELNLARFDRTNGREDLMLRLSDEDAASTLDRRLVVALAILLDQNDAA